MKISASITGVLVAIGIAMGFLVGRMTTAPEDGSEKNASGNGSRGAPPEKSDRLIGGFGTRSGEGPERAGGGGRRSAAATIRAATRNLELSPMAQMDFDAMFEVYEAVRWMTPEDVKEALEELETMQSGQQIKMVMTMMLISQWAKQDGKGAVEYALAQEQAMQKTMGVMGGIMGWVKHDPEGAYAWYEENRGELSGAGMMAGQMDGMILAALAHRDMDRAFEGLQELSQQQQNMAIAMMSGQMTMDPEKREQFVQRLESLDDESMRKRGLESMVQMWAFQDPQGAVEFVESREWEGDLGADLRESIANSWSNMDAKAALEWRLENVGDSETRASVVATGFSQWMTQDPESAQEWLETQPAEVKTDDLYQQTANSLRWRENYPDAAQWAVQINDPESRESTLRDLYGSWNQNDEEAAQQWLGGLDEATREAVLQPAEAPEAPAAEAP